MIIIIIGLGLHKFGKIMVVLLIIGMEAIFIMGFQRIRGVLSCNKRIFISILEENTIFIYHVLLFFLLIDLFAINSS